MGFCGGIVMNKKFKVTNPMLKKFEKFFFPGSLLLLILLSLLFSYIKVLPFDLSIVPLIIGGVFVTWNTWEATIKLKKITAGIMVVLALIGTTYVGEYLAGAIVAFMMIIGEFLEEVTLDKTRNAVKALIKLVPEVAWKKINGKYEQVSIKKIRVGDMLLVKPGERIPVDGIILTGQAAINESSLTGESMPVDKTFGDKVYVGTLNENGVLEIKVEKIGGDTALGKIIKTVKLAQESKGDVQKAADQFAKWFTPIIIAICIIVWFLTYDLMRVMTILVIACPCALVLATPTAVVACVGNAAKKGVLIKGGVTIERAARITSICLDKTGTITQGKPKLVNLKSFGQFSTNEVLLYAAIAEKNSQHPIAKAVLEQAELEGLGDIPDSHGFEMLFGRGIKVRYDDQVIEVSNSRALENVATEMRNNAIQFLDEERHNGRTALVIIVNEKVIGGISIADTIRANVAETIQSFKEAGIKRIIMLTGDNEITAKSIADQIGITEYYANLLPNDKLDKIKELKESGEIVAMVGDGVNDAPALVLSDVGISMGVIGTDVAIESSDIALMADEIKMVTATLALSKRTFAIIQQNIWLFAVVVNVAGVTLSGMGFLSPIIAAIVHNISSVFVVLNSARLLSYSYEKSVSPIYTTIDQTGYVKNDRFM
jgi:Cd2+/Zn2+-exporting ATPase